MGAAGNVTAPPLITVATAVAGTGSGDEAIAPVLSTDGIRACSRARRASARPYRDADRIGSTARRGRLPFTRSRCRRMTPVARHVSFDRRRTGSALARATCSRPGTYTLVVEHEAMPRCETRDGDAHRIAAPHLCSSSRCRVGSASSCPSPARSRSPARTPALPARRPRCPARVDLPAGKYSLTIDTGRLPGFRHGRRDRGSRQTPDARAEARARLVRGHGLERARRRTGSRRG